MRFVEMKLDPERLAEFHKVYDERVMPVFNATPGCLYASLIQSTDRPGECISMTLWDKQQSAEAYEKGGTYNQLMEGVSQYLADASEWKVRLSDDLTMNYEQVTEEPVVEAFQVTAPSMARSIPEESALFVRIVAPQVRPGKAEEFQRIYQENVLPVLRTVKGCRYVYLTKSASDKDRFMSVTIWNSKEDAAAYEQSGLFQELTGKLGTTLSEVYQWRMQLQKTKQDPDSPTKDLEVEGYTIVTGKNFL